MKQQVQSQLTPVMITYDDSRPNGQAYATLRNTRSKITTNYCPTGRSKIYYLYSRSLARLSETSTPELSLYQEFRQYSLPLTLYFLSSNSTISQLYRLSGHSPSLWNTLYCPQTLFFIDSLQTLFSSHYPETSTTLSLNRSWPITERCPYMDRCKRKWTGKINTRRHLEPNILDPSRGRFNIINVYRSALKRLLFLSDINGDWISWTDFRNIPNLKFLENSSIGTSVAPSGKTE
jgi:hypothetical protein